MTVLMPGQSLPKTTISALTSDGLKNWVFLAPALINFFSFYSCCPALKTQFLIKKAPGFTIASGFKKGYSLVFLSESAIKGQGNVYTSVNSRSTIKLETLSKSHIALVMRSSYFLSPSSV